MDDTEIEVLRRLAEDSARRAVELQALADKLHALSTGLTWVVVALVVALIFNIVGAFL